jgi:glycosyltransferase involved in cell wall biosynthesis
VHLVIMIPAYDEAATIAETITAIPREIPGFRRISILVIDDGSTDGTADVARAAGATHVARHRWNRGLARAFMTGIEEALELGAHVIVNTDADNQYQAQDIPLLVAPILADEADIVVGVRPIGEMPTFSRAKRWTSRFGSFMIQLASGTKVPDAPSGFRAFSRDAARQLAVYSSYTYTLETLIQAGQSNLDVVTVPVRVNGHRRPSRLMRGWVRYVLRNAVTVLRLLVIYRPFRFFATLGTIVTTMGLVLLGRFSIAHLQGVGQGRLQSAVIGAALLAIGVQMLLAGMIADSLSVNRRLLEQIRRRTALTAPDEEILRQPSSRRLSEAMNHAQRPSTRSNGRVAGVSGGVPQSTSGAA